MSASDQAYIEQTFEGGLEAYKASHNARFAAAVASGDTTMMAKIQADANRVGFSLNPSGLGVSQPRIGATIGAKVTGGTITGSTGGGGSRGDGFGGATSVTGGSGASGGTAVNMGDLGIMSKISDFLPVALVGAFVLFFFKAILD